MTGRASRRELLALVVAKAGSIQVNSALWGVCLQAALKLACLESFQAASAADLDTRDRRFDEKFCCPERTFAWPVSAAIVRRHFFFLPGSLYGRTISNYIGEKCSTCSRKSRI